MERYPNEKSISNNYNHNHKNQNTQNSNNNQMNNIYGNKYTSNNIRLGDDDFNPNNLYPQNNINYPGYEVANENKQSPPKKKKGFFARFFGMFSSGKKDDNKKEEKNEKKPSQPDQSQYRKNNYSNDQNNFNLGQNNIPAYHNNISPEQELGLKDDDYKIPAENKYIPPMPIQRNTIFDTCSLDTLNKSSKEIKNSHSLQNTANIAPKNLESQTPNDTIIKPQNTVTNTSINNLPNRDRTNIGVSDPPILRLRQSDLNHFLEQYFNVNTWDNPNNDFNMNLGN